MGWIVYGWLVSVLFVAAGLWNSYSSTPFPISNFRRLADAEPYIQWMEIVPVVLSAIWLSLTRLHSRDWMLRFWGVAFATFAYGTFIVGSHYFVYLGFVWAANDATSKPA